MHVGSHRGWIRPAVDVIAVEELVLLQQGWLGQAVLVGHHLIPTPGPGSGRGVVVAQGMHGLLGPSVVNAGQLVVYLIVLKQKGESAQGCPNLCRGHAGDRDGTHQCRAGDQGVLLQLQGHSV